MTLFDADRARRLQRLYETGPLERIGAFVLAGWLILVGVAGVFHSLG